MTADGQRRADRRSWWRGDDGSSTYPVTPAAGGAWPAGATIVITLDATTTNLLGQTIAAAATVTFTAP